MAILMTASATDRVKSFLDNRGKGLGLRVGIKTTGCSGMAYVLEFVDELNEDDSAFEIDGVTLVVDAKSLVFIDGTELDFQKEGLNEGFKFNNPNIKGECGCGESFTV
jgi:iron-sulfur cluster assembly protein